MADSTTKKDTLQVSAETLSNTAKKVSLGTSLSPTPVAIPQHKFKFHSNVPQRSTWYDGKSSTDNSHPLYYVKIAIEHSDLPQGALIRDRVPREYLFKLAPKLHQHLDVTNTKIILPRNSADEDTVHDVVTAIIVAEKQKKKFTMHVEKTPITLIKIHAVLALFGMKREAEIVKSLAWDSVAIHELSPQEVDWVWDTYGVWDSGVKAEMETGTNIPQHNEEEVKKNVKLWKVVNKNKDDTESEQAYVAQYAREYVEMMAYQILNLEALGKLNDVILRMILDQCLSLKKVLENRKEIYGLGPGYKAPSFQLNTPLSTPNMDEQKPKTIPKDVKKTEKPPNPTPAPKKASVITKPLPHRTPAMEAALNRKPSVLNFSRTTVGIMVGNPDEGRRLPHGKKVASWIDQDPNRPSKSLSSFLAGAPMFTLEGFMKSVEVSMKKGDDEVDMFGQIPTDAPTGPISFQSNASSGSVFGSGSSTTEVPTGLRNGGFSGSTFGPGNTLAGLPMVDQVTQTGTSLNATWGFNTFVSPQHQLSTDTSYPDTAMQSFSSSRGSTIATSTPTQSFIDKAAFSGFGEGQVNGSGNASGGAANAAGNWGGDNMFAFQSNGSFNARKKAKPRGRLGGRR
jgi:hypothetical protein